MRGLFPDLSQEVLPALLAVQCSSTLAVSRWCCCWSAAGLLLLSVVYRWFYLNSWYPPDLVTVPYSLVEAAVGMANVAAAPLAASLLLLDGQSGMHGWQW